jgi:hypothetical protein
VIEIELLIEIKRQRRGLGGSRPVSEDPAAEQQEGDLAR